MYPEKIEIDGEEYYTAATVRRMAGLGHRASIANYATPHIKRGGIIYYAFKPQFKSALERGYIRSIGVAKHLGMPPRIVQARLCQLRQSGAITADKFIKIGNFFFYSPEVCEIIKNSIRSSATYYEYEKIEELFVKLRQNGHYRSKKAVCQAMSPLLGIKGSSIYRSLCRMDLSKKRANRFIEAMQILKEQQ